MLLKQASTKGSWRSNTPESLNTHRDVHSRPYRVYDIINNQLKQAIHIHSCQLFKSKMHSCQVSEFKIRNTLTQAPVNGLAIFRAKMVHTDLCLEQKKKLRKKKSWEQKIRDVLPNWIPLTTFKDRLSSFQLRA